MSQYFPQIRTHSTPLIPQLAIGWKLWPALQRLAECEIGKEQNEKLLAKLKGGWMVGGKFAVVASQSAI